MLLCVSLGQVSAARSVGLRPVGCVPVCCCCCQHAAHSVACILLVATACCLLVGWSCASTVCAGKPRPLRLRLFLFLKAVFAACARPCASCIVKDRTACCHAGAGV